MPEDSPKKCFVICPNPSIDILASVGPIRPSASNRIQTQKRFPGGKGVHVALALAEMNIPTMLMGFWGSQNGSWLTKACHDFQPNLEISGPKLDGWNRSCSTFQSDTVWNDTELLGPGPLMKDEDFEELLALIRDSQSEISSLAICGSWPQGAKSHYTKTIVDLGKEQGIPVFIDCTGIQLNNALASKPFCVHLNRSEVMDYFKSNFDKAKDQMINFCEIAAITDGSSGLYLQSKTDKVHANVSITNVKSTVGSGDCLMAGLIAGYYKQLPLQEIAKMGVACGAANCLNEDLGMLTKPDVDALLTRAELY